MIALSICWNSGYRWAASFERKAFNLTERFASKFVFLLHYSRKNCCLKTGSQLLQSSCLQQAIYELHQLVVSSARHPEEKTFGNLEMSCLHLKMSCLHPEQGSPLLLHPWEEATSKGGSCRIPAVSVRSN